MGQPQVIFLDAVGTLFGVRGSVGQIYGEVAQKYQVSTDVEALNQAFFQAFQAADKMAFPQTDPTTVPAQEYGWWYRVAHRTFEAVGVLPDFENFDRFFEDLYRHFATADPWVVYDDTHQSLVRWRRQGIELGIISNFDSRLYMVLEVLDLAQFFQSVTLSSEVGAAKPDAAIFAAALRKHNCPAAQAWHVGDSRREDVAGAQAAGLHGIWLNREDAKKP